MTRELLIWTLLGGLALAEEAAVDADPAEVAEPADLAGAWSTLAVEEVLAEAVSRRRVGDFQGSLDRLGHLEGRADAPAAEVLHQRGITLEYMERFEEALAAYDAALGLSSPGETVHGEVSFRRALVLEDLGRHADSLQQVRDLQRQGGWTEPQELSLELSRGVAELRSGSTRRGLRRLDRALARLEGDAALPWLQARARTAVAGHLLAEAETLALEGNKKARRRLLARTELMVAAEAHVIAVARLGEPEYILEGLRLLGDAYLALHDDMLAAPPPGRLDAEQRALYAEAVAERAAVLPAKALRYYDEGVQVAVRTAWEGEVVQELRARRDATAAEL